MRSIFSFGLTQLVLMSLVQSFSSVAYPWTIDKVQGGVTLSSKGKKTPAAEKVALKKGDVLETAADGKILLRDGESEIWLASSTRMSVHKLTDADREAMGRLDLATGQMRAKFKKPLGPQAYPYEVKTKSLIVGVRGTEFFVSVAGSDEQVTTLEGLVRVSSARSAAESWDVAAGHGLFVKPNEMPKVRETSGDQAKKWIEATSF